MENLAKTLGMAQSTTTDHDAIAASWMFKLILKTLVTYQSALC